MGCRAFKNLYGNTIFTTYLCERFRSSHWRHQWQPILMTDHELLTDCAGWRCCCVQYINIIGSFHLADFKIRQILKFIHAILSSIYNKTIRYVTSMYLLTFLPGLLAVVAWFWLLMLKLDGCLSWSMQFERHNLNFSKNYYVNFYMNCWKYNWLS